MNCLVPHEELLKFIPAHGNWSKDIIPSLFFLRQGHVLSSNPHAIKKDLELSNPLASLYLSHTSEDIASNYECGLLVLLIMEQCPLTATGSSSTDQFLPNLFI